MDLYVKESGQHYKSCILFLHGREVSGWMWDKQVSYFEGYHCIVVDLPEQGKSLDSEAFSIHSTAVWLNYYIEEIKEEKEIILIGYGLGAQVAIQLMSRRPNLIDYAILSSISVRPSEFKRNRLIHFLPRFFPLLKKESFLKLRAKRLYISKIYIEKFIAEMKRMELDTYERILRENISFEMPEHLHLAKTKTLVIVGLREKGMIKRSTIDLVTELPNATGAFIPMIRDIPFAKPNYFNEMVENWLRDESLPEDALPFN